MESSTLPNEEVIKITADIVAVASHVDNDHKSIEVVEKGVKVRRCSIYPNISCEDHMRTSEVGMKYIKGRFAAPVSIWTDPSGKEMFRKSGYRQPEAFLADVKDALGRVSGSRISKSDYDKQAIPLDEAEAAARDGKYRIAIDGFTKASQGSIETLRTSATTGLDSIKRTGQGLLARAKAALDSSRRDQARELLKLIESEFGALDCGREASALLKKLGEEKDTK